MSTSPKLCGVCLEDYNESERCPRILICSHTLCSRCVEDLISNNKKACPFCCREFVANSTDDVIVNLAVLELIKNLAERDSDLWNIQKSSSVSLLGKLGELKSEALEISRRQFVQCGEKQQEAEHKIQEIEGLSDTIIRENEKIEKDILLKFQKAVAENCRTLEELNQTRMQLQEQIKQIQSQKENLDDVIQKIQTTTAETFKEISGILDEAEVVNLSVSKWKDNFQIMNENKSLETKRKRVTRDCNISSTILELLNSPDKCEVYIESIQKAEAVAIVDESPSEDFQQQEQQRQEEQSQLQEEQQLQEPQPQVEQQKQAELQKAKQRLQLQKKQQQQKTKEERELEPLEKKVKATQSLNTQLLFLRSHSIKVNDQPRTNHSVSYPFSKYYDDF